MEYSLRTLSVGILNKMQLDDVITFKEAIRVRIRRVLGGYMYEYYNKSSDVTAAVFVSTDELRNE